ncbi:MAG: M43 family zinc metalloprotease [Vicingaceae bacterium]
MKKIISLLVISFLTLTISKAQSEWCATDEELEKYHQAHPDLKAEYQEEMIRFARTYEQTPDGNKNNTTYVIPVVVHVIHYNGIGNISKTQILDGLDIINEDFQKLNSDTSAIRSIYQNLVADVDIEFRLAQLDPNGNCTEGITRTNSYFTFNKRNEPKQLIGWDPFSYLNVWIVNSIQSSGPGNTLGFAQFPPPSSGSASTYGLVVRSDQWGSIEAASGTDGRTVTHEIGHCLNLYHPFQGGCGSFCHASGDFVCDTPPQFDDNNNSCSFSINSCSNDASGGIGSNPNPFSSNVPDQLENYMGYGLSCLGMFTPIQKNRIYSAINSYTKLSSLVTNANLIQTGTNDGYTAPPCVPVAEVQDFDKFICEGGQLSFTEDSYGGPITTYSWSFPGGTPSTSTQANPTITYNTAGEYDVILRVSNASGIDSLVLPDYVHVGSNNASLLGFGYTESFENVNTFANDWEVVSPSGNPTWARVPFAAKTGSASVWVNNLNNNYEGGVDQLISPSIDLSVVSNPSLRMEVAYRKKVSNSNEQLRIKASIDCGQNWLTLITLPSSFLAAQGSPNQTSNFVPTSASDWRTVNLPNAVFPPTVRNSNNVRFMFELVNGNGNNLFMDDFSILGSAVGEKELNIESVSDMFVFPNPASQTASLKVFQNKAVGQADIYMTDLLGKKVKSIYSGSMGNKEYRFELDLSDLEQGVYLVNIRSEKGMKTQKLVVQ